MNQAKLLVKIGILLRVQPVEKKLQDGIRQVIISRLFGIKSLPDHHMPTKKPIVSDSADHANKIWWVNFINYK